MAINPPSDPAGEPPENTPPTGDPSTPLTPDQLRAENARLRRESAGYRLRNKGELAEFRQQLGLKDGEEVSVVLDRHKALTAENRTLKLDLGLERAIAKHGAKRSIRGLLVDNGSLGKLDPSKDDFEQTVEDLISETLQSAPEFRGPSVPTRSSAPFRPPVAREQLSRSDLAFLSPEEIVKAREAGLLDELLGGPQGRR